MENEFEEVVKEIQKWQVKTFPEQSHRGVLNHLMKEVEELEKELETDNSFKEKELAIKELVDIFFLSFNLANRLKLDITDLSIYMKEKLEINKRRTWEKVENYYHHINKENE